MNLPEPLGPKLFILGEPVLHRTWDWKKIMVTVNLTPTYLNLPEIAGVPYETRAYENPLVSLKASY